jgi:hypothetical protein
MPTADPAAPPASPDVAEALAQAHDASTLAAALIVRLVAEGMHETAEAVRAMLGTAEGIIDPGPPHPGATR